MPKTTGAFSGIKLTDQTPSPRARLDQRLFTVGAPKPTPQQAVSGEDQEVGKEGMKEAGKLPSQLGKSERAQLFDINLKPYRKDSFLFTDEEFEALEDLKLELRRKFDLPATKNDLVRSAIQNLIEDYRRHGEVSVAVRRLKNRTGR